MSPPSYYSSPVISVVIPVYNIDQYIAESIESILQQHFSDFELIIVDDGSTDNTWQIIQSFNDNRIIAFRNETNRGNYPSRNLGMSKARGKYICVMDGDDIAFPERLQIQWEYMEKHPEVLVVGSNARIMHTGSLRGTSLTQEKVSLALLNNNCILHPSLMLRTGQLHKMGGYDEKYRYAADYDLLCRFSLEGPVVCLPDVLMMYRHHPGQISSRFRSEQMRYADEIRRKYQVAFINRYKSEKQELAGETEVGEPVIGMAIAYYTYAQYTNNVQWEVEADELVEHIFQTTPKDIPLCLNRGLCGIGCGILYLLRNNFVRGNEEEVMEEIDGLILEVISEQEKKEKKDGEWEDLILYRNYRFRKSGEMR